MANDASLPRIFLQAGRDRRVADGHPWAYSNEIRMDEAAKSLTPGSLATLHRVDGKALGVGSFNPHTLIAFRMFDRNPSTIIDDAFLAGRLARARTLRERLFDEPYYRLIHAEADGLPGLVCDRYGDVLVVQATTAGMEALLPPLLSALEQVLQPAAIVLRNDAPSRGMEGLAEEVRIVRGQIDGPVPVKESGLMFLADVCAGQKTGWFFDQRDARAFTAVLARGGSVLDLYCYTGGFTVRAAAAGASRVLGVDSSEAALELARQAAEANGLADRCSFQRGDVFAQQQRLAAENARFRLVIADPPAFVKSRKDLGSGLRGYRKLARLAAPLVEPGGFLFVASCSHNVSPEALLGEVVHGVSSAGRSGRVLREAKAPPDHPVHPHLPETAYLKSVVLQLD